MCRESSTGSPSEPSPATPSVVSSAPLVYSGATRGRSEIGRQASPAKAIRPSRTMRTERSSRQTRRVAGLLMRSGVQTSQAREPPASCSATMLPHGDMSCFRLTAKVGGVHGEIAGYCERPNGTESRCACGDTAVVRWCAIDGIKSRCLFFGNSQELLKVGGRFPRAETIEGEPRNVEDSNEGGFRSASARQVKRPLASCTCAQSWHLDESIA